jgi:hypothetical protein
LGPDHGRWKPTTWAEVQAAASGGLLDETSWVELKEMIAPGKPANLELARDLASLALRAGLMIVGIAAAGAGAGAVVGVKLGGFRDRIDQVAGNRIDPPLYVDSREIEDPDRPGYGCVLVSVPATGPHQADGRYWGRGDTGKRVLTDAEVREHLARWRVGEADLTEHLRASERQYLALPGVSDEDPESLGRVRLFLRAVPIDARAECLLALVEDGAAGQRVRDLANEVGARRPGHFNGSTLAETYTWAPHAQGRVMSTVLDANVNAGKGLQVVIEEDGAFEVIQDKLSYPTQSRWGGPEAPRLPALATGIALETVHDVVGLAGVIGGETAAYQGLWRIGVRFSDLTGYYDYFRIARGNTRLLAGYSGSAYEKVILTSTAEMRDEPAAITERLLARLIRGLSVPAVYLPYAPGSQALAFTQGQR